MDNKALLYQPQPTLRVWVALFASILIHAGAVAIAQLDREPIPTVGAETSPPVIDGVLEPTSPDESPSDIETVETPSLPPPDEDSIPEETSASTPPPRTTRRNAPPLSHPSTNRGVSSYNSGSARVMALSAPLPEYPYEARRSRLTGNGVAIMTINWGTGAVTNVTMEKSTGSAILDQATIAGLRRWRFKPGTPVMVRCPITFTLVGAVF